MRATVDDYGWKETRDTCAHGYVQPAVIAALRAIGARRVLDLGCGNGALTHALVRAGFDVTGCDADRTGIELARRGGGRFEIVSVYDDPAHLGASGFDAVVSAEVIEHLYAPRALPRFARAVLAPGGRLVLTTPYHGYLKNLALAITGRWDDHLTALWDGGHIKFWSQRTLGRLLADEGWRVESFRGLGRLPWLWKSMLLVARPD